MNQEEDLYYLDDLLVELNKSGIDIDKIKIIESEEDVSPGSTFQNKEG